MSTIKDIREQIAALTTELNQLIHKETYLKKQEFWDKFCVKAVCSKCSGTGQIMSMGVDNMDMDYYECDSCYGEGFHYVRKFAGNRFYNRLGSQVGDY